MRGWVAVVAVGLAIATIMLGNFSSPAGNVVANIKDATAQAKEASFTQADSKVPGADVDPQRLVHVPDPTQSASHRGAIRFFDGETVDVRFRSQDGNGPSYPEHLASKLQEWKQAARSRDAEAARILYKALNRCRDNLYESDQDFAAAMDRFQQTHVIQKTVAGHELTVRKEPTPELLADLRESYEFCKGIEEDEVLDAETWHETAAINGSVLAQLSLGQKLLNTPEGRAYLEMAWKAGNIDAAGWLGKSLTIRNDKISSNLVSAYAYKALYAELVRAEFESRGTAETSFAKTWMAADAKGIDRIESQLRPHELEAAQKLTKKLYFDNSNCCLWR